MTLQEKQPSKSELSRGENLRKRDHNLAGLWGGSKQAAQMVKGVHAVGEATEFGKRTAACGLAGRFIPDALNWRELKDSPITVRCVKCLDLLRGAKP